MVWTEQMVIDALTNPESSTKVALKGVWFLWLYQTADEQVSRMTKHDNNVGFNAFDAFTGSKIGSAMNAVVEKYGGENNVPWERALLSYRFKGRPLCLTTCDKWLDEARRIVRRHAAQVARISNERRSVAA